MATANVKGKIFKVLPMESGEGKNGTWYKRTVITEVENGKYSKKIAVVMWADLATKYEYQEGDSIDVEVDIESREWQGKWFSDIKAWRMNNSGSNHSNGGGNKSSSTNSSSSTSSSSGGGGDVPLDDTDLPF